MSLLAIDCLHIAKLPECRYLNIKEKYHDRKAANTEHLLQTKK